MRGSGLMHPTDLIPVTSDSIGTVAASTGGTGFTWPTGAQLVWVSPAVGILFNGVSTGASTAGDAPSSGLSSGSSNRNEYFPPNIPQWRQIDGASTGFSIAAATAGGGLVTLSFFKKS